jgi:arylformamidase
MIYDLSQPHFNGAPQFPKQPPNSIEYQQLAVVEGATVERCTLMTHSGSHVDAPFHYLPSLPCVHELPLRHFFGPCVALDMRGLPPGHGMTSADLRKHEALITSGVFVLLKTGWGEKRANTKDFLTQWPYMSGDGAKYLLERGVKGMGLDGLSTGGYPDEKAESEAHELLLGASKLLLESFHMPEALLDGKRRFFAALPILIANAGGGWVRAIVWDAGDLEREEEVPEQPALIPDFIKAQIALERQGA